MRRIVATLGLLFLTGLVPAAAEIALVPASRDATLIEDPLGANANGSGPYLFAGRTSQSQNGIRRGLLYFDVANALPEGAVVESVSLRLRQSGSNSGVVAVGLHRVQAGWSEGPSASSGGGGAPSQSGDVTWKHTRYAGDYWVRPGGQFIGRASATTEVGGAGVYHWESTAQLVNDVRLWLANPGRNFGWALLGDETEPQSAKRLASRENPDPASRPRLEITYR